MKLHWSIAAGVPIAIDCYVVAAFRSSRDVPAAMTIMALSLAAATGSHMAEQSNVALPAWATVAVTGVMLLILVVVLWRVHVITHDGDPVAAPAPPAPDPTLVQVRTETVTVTATRSVAYLPATYVRTIAEPRSAIGEAPTRRAIGDRRSDRVIAADATSPIRSTSPIGEPAPPRSGNGERRTGRPPIPQPWVDRSAIASGAGGSRSSDDLVADLLAAVRPGEPEPTASAIQAHYGIGTRAREVRDAFKATRARQGTGGVEGDLS